MERCWKALLLITAIADAAIAGADGPSFDAVIAPLLATRCLGCHQGDEPKGNLNLTREETFRAGGDSGPSVVSRDAQNSILWQRVRDDEMPPKEALSADEKNLLRDWIDKGASWESGPIDPLRYSSTARAGYDWWSLQPVRRPMIPLEPAAENPVDAFVAHERAKHALKPSGKADRRTLLRRLSYDLTGLPPTWSEVVAFDNAVEPDAYDREIDRLLASPRYGERWARHWLDLARYGESDGFERNAPRPHSWHYRDWIITALNSDMPYDAFCRLQLAGDALAGDDPRTISATGFLVAGIHNTVLGNDQMRAIARQDELEDIVGVIGQAFLGLTVNCARCHDHKFDPISQRDYYRLSASLAGVDHGLRPMPRPNVKTQLASMDAELKQISDALSSIDRPAQLAVMERKGIRSTTPLPTPLAAWNVNEGLHDLVGDRDLSLTAASERSEGQSYWKSRPLQVELAEKTLEAWVSLGNLTQQGGGIITLQAAGGSIFDSLVYGEREPGQWMAGSNGFTRTQSFRGVVESSTGAVHVALVYQADGTVACFRNGVEYGASYRTTLQKFPKDSLIILGCRHEPPGGNRMLAGTIERARVYARALTTAEITSLYQSGGLILTDREIGEALSPNERKQRDDLNRCHANLQRERDALAANADDQAYAAVARDPGKTFVLARGDLKRPREELGPGAVSAVAGSIADFQIPSDAPESARRIQLAQWIARKDNPLFARVIVNRLWHHHFGLGIVETTNDLGFNGGKPSHPDLIDWLADELWERQASLKEIHRMIVASTTYRQSSHHDEERFAKDASNRFLWRKSPTRLDAESLRDSLLEVSGILQSDMGGPSVSDYRVIDQMNGTTYYEPIDPSEGLFQRRSIYRFIPRGGSPSLLDVFDCPDPAVSTPRRNSTTTPLQFLSLWNGEFALRIADELAASLQKESPNGRHDQVTLLYHRLFQRDPSPREAAAAAELASRHGLAILCRALVNSNEFLTVE